LENDFSDCFDLLFSSFLAGYQAGDPGWMGGKIEQEITV